MFKPRFIFTIILIIPAFTFIVAMRSLGSPESQAVQQTRADYSRYADSLTNSLLRLEQMLRTSQATEGKTAYHRRSLQAFTAVRDWYKHIEWLHSYLDPDDAKNFNGSPLPKLDEHIPAVVVIEPQGLQTIEEKLSATSWLHSKEERDSILRLLELARSDANDIRGLLHDRTITDRQLLEAARYNILRIITLGITGFDSPALGRSLQECVISWRQSRNVLQLYHSFFVRHDSSSAKRLSALLASGEMYLMQHQEFDRFDRWEFIRTYANPVYAAILDVHTASGIEFDTEVSGVNRPVNYKARTIFQTNALNPLGYARSKYETHTAEQITVGKTLFYDPVLSRNQTMSCASCHQPDRAFTDGVAKSAGSRPGTTVERNAPTLINSAFATKYFYDQRTDFLEEQIEHVISNDLEFHTSYIEIATKLGKSEEYRRLFAAAYGAAGQISAGMISSALSAYVRSLVAMDSPVDKALRGEPTPLHGTQLNAVKRGFNLFMGKAACGTCHFPPTYSGLVPPFYTDTESEVLGVLRTPSSKTIDPDLGKAGVYKYRSNIYRHSFKTSTVRNVLHTAPYMHNGAYPTLEHVMEFYNNGGGAGIGVSVPHQTLPPEKLHLRKSEITDLIHFMKALTDLPSAGY